MTRPAPSIGPARIALRFAGLHQDIVLPGRGGLADALHRTLHGWAAQRRPATTRQATPLAVVTEGRTGRFNLTSSHLDDPFEDLPRASTVCALIADLAEAFCAARPGRTGLHCGAVRLGDGPLMLLTGAARAGKSTLVARLALEPDAQVFCDDILPVEPDGTALALGAPPRLRLPLPPRLQARAPQIGLADADYGYLETATLAPHGTTARPGALVALQRRPGPARLHHLPADRALWLLLGQSITGHPDAASAFARARALSEGLPALTLAYEDLDEAVALLRRAFAADAPEPEPALPDPAPHPAPPPHPARQLRRSPGTAIRRHGDGLFLWQIGGTRLWHLNPLARAIWLLLEAPQTPAMLTATLAPLFPEADPQQVGADIGAFLGTALEEGLLV